MAYYPMFIPIFMGGCGDITFTSSLTEWMVIIGVIIALIGMAAMLITSLVDITTYRDTFTAMGYSIAVVVGGGIIAIIGLVLELIFEAIL